MGAIPPHFTGFSRIHSSVSREFRTHMKKAELEGRHQSSDLALLTAVSPVNKHSPD